VFSVVCSEVLQSHFSHYFPQCNLSCIFPLYSVLFMFHRHSCSLYSSTYLHVNSSFHLAAILNTHIALLQPKQIIHTHTPTSCALLASGRSHETGEGQVTCWYWWGKASCLKNRTALPGSLSSNLPCLEISGKLTAKRRN
jgi:hypothetical protein